MRAWMLLTGLSVAAALGGCASVDESLFGSKVGVSATEPSTTPAPESPDGSEDTGADASAPAASPPVSGPDQATGSSTAGTLPSTVPDAASIEPPVAPAAAIPAPAAPSPAPAVPVAGVSARGPAAAVVTVAGGADTGTAVSKTIAGLRAGLQEVSGRLTANAQQFSSLRASSVQQLTTYNQAQAQISSRLQIGTTRGNPELVAQWNAAQAALDQLTSNVNALGALSSRIAADETRTRTLLSQIQGMSSAAGGVEEDQRQLGVIEDEANQISVVLGRLGRDVTADIRRQTASLSNERAKLPQLAAAIKSGDLYATQSSRGSTVVEAGPAAPVASGPAPVVAIRFARAKTNYQKTLYDALSKALQAQPTASFRVIGVSPTRGTAAAVQAAQTDSLRHAQDVMRTMTQMGVPAERMEISSATDPSVRVSEVRVFLR
ncbi:MAG: hypothetical protein JO056_00910 [Alphaproteobacteria bacterium]|nr:hypothetical protein [Alphaproteobacteria bacterium]